METKTCNACLADKPLDQFHRSARGRLGRRAGCKVCFKKKYLIGKEYRARAIAATQRYRKKYPYKNAARSMLYHHVHNLRTVVKPDKCETCGATGKSIHGHHHDYSKPLDVEWLCVACHNTLHHNQGSLADE